MLTTLSVPTRGTGRVAGFDIIEQPNDVRRSMGLTGQAATVDEILTGDRKSTRLNSSHGYTSYAVRCLNKESGQRRCGALRTQVGPAGGCLLRASRCGT